MSWHGPCWHRCCSAQLGVCVCVCVFGRFETYIDLPPQLVAPVLDSGDASQGSEGVGDERRPAAVAAAAEATLDALLVAFVEKQPQWMTQLQAVRGVFTHTPASPPSRPSPATATVVGASFGTCSCRH